MIIHIGKQSAYKFWLLRTVNICLLYNHSEEAFGEYTTLTEWLEQEKNDIDTGNIISNKEERQKNLQVLRNEDVRMRAYIYCALKENNLEWTISNASRRDLF